ncbi:hypothetical protein OPV22_018720 [Ensete ventricosum]|uniref:Uncharacterized protein n=1 Tax=Ensete ventricosum TaxID=4639 RepID=A0AAV8PGI6_ENSVE|nr:hypothetical protein OPV22_018720 [Ensete ventricosum]
MVEKGVGFACMPSSLLDLSLDMGEEFVDSPHRIYRLTWARNSWILLIGNHGREGCGVRLHALVVACNPLSLSSIIGEEGDEVARAPSVFAMCKDEERDDNPRTPSFLVQGL